MRGQQPGGEGPALEAPVNGAAAKDEEDEGVVPGHGSGGGDAGGTAARVAADVVGSGTAAPHASSRRSSILDPTPNVPGRPDLQAEHLLGGGIGGSTVGGAAFLPLLEGPRLQRGPQAGAGDGVAASIEQKLRKQRALLQQCSLETERVLANMAPLIRAQQVIHEQRVESVFVALVERVSMDMNVQRRQLDEQLAVRAQEAAAQQRATEQALALLPPRPLCPVAAAAPRAGGAAGHRPQVSLRRVRGPRVPSLCGARWRQHRGRVRGGGPHL